MKNITNDGEQVDNDRSVSKLSAALLHTLPKSVQLSQDHPHHHHHHHHHQQQQQQSHHRSQEKPYSISQQVSATLSE
ncbi:uncharacterized protein LOC144009934 isoform X3 [Festucalex cinctus]